MDMREAFISEIEQACEELKRAGIPHAIDLAKHIVRMKKELRFYDKCHAQDERRKEIKNGGEVIGK